MSLTHSEPRDQDDRTRKAVESFLASREPLDQTGVNSLAHKIGFDSSPIERHSPSIEECVVLTQDKSNGEHAQVIISQGGLGLYRTSVRVTTSLFSSDDKKIARKDTLSADSLADAQHVIERHLREIEIQRDFPCDTYIKTHVRIDTAKYRHKDLPYNLSIGFHSQDDKIAFNDDVRQCLERIGFKPFDPEHTSRGDCHTMVRGRESLYCHPDDLSGYLKEGTAQEILDVLQYATTFKYRSLDEYERKLDITPTGFQTILERNLETIKSTLTEQLKTKSKSLAVREKTVGIDESRFINAFMSHDVPSERFSVESNALTFAVAKRNVIRKALDELVASGQVQQTEHNGESLLRTRSKAELAQWRREQKSLARETQTQPAAQASDADPADDDLLSHTPGM